jgi:RNA-binding protein MEX3
MNTYIKTRGRGVFLITGSKEDVEMAKRESLSEAKLFSLIQAAFNKAGC